MLARAEATMLASLSTPDRYGHTSKRRFLSGTTPLSRRDRSSSVSTRRPSRSVCFRAVRIVSGSASVTPSTMFSSTARSPAMGVRSSCETLATSSLRWRSWASSSSAMTLIVWARSPSSSRRLSRTRRV